MTAATTSPIETARKRLAAARVIERNQRLGRYHGRNSVSTERTLRAHYDAADVALRGLSRGVVADVWTEHALATRVAMGRENGQQRPELRARLAAVRESLKGATS